MFGGPQQNPHREQSYEQASHPALQNQGRVSHDLPRCRGPIQGNSNESPRPYMQPTNLKAIVRDAALRGDTKTLIHTLDLLERLIPIATFMDFCTELEELRLRGGEGAPRLI